MNTRIFLINLVNYLLLNDLQFYYQYYHYFNYHNNKRSKKTIDIKRRFKK